MNLNALFSRLTSQLSEKSEIITKSGISPFETILNSANSFSISFVVTTNIFFSGFFLRKTFIAIIGVKISFLSIEKPNCKSFLYTESGDLLSVFVKNNIFFLFFISDTASIAPGIGAPLKYNVPSISHSIPLIFFRIFFHQIFLHC